MGGGLTVGLLKRSDLACVVGVDPYQPLGGLWQEPVSGVLR